MLSIQRSCVSLKLLRDSYLHMEEEPRRTSESTSLLASNLHFESSSTSELHRRRLTSTKTVAPFERPPSFASPAQDLTNSVHNLEQFIHPPERLIVTAIDSLMAPFYDSPRYSDITIKFAQHQIRAHKVILAQQSKYFATAFFSGFQVNTSSAMNDARLTPPGCIKPCHRSG